MRFKILLLSSALMAFSAKLFAGVMPADSVGVENNNGKKVILHKLDPKDNYYSLGRKYGVNPKVIQQFNNNANLQIGHIIKVPTERSIVENVPAQPKTETPAQAQVKASANPPVVQQQQTPKKDEAKNTLANNQQANVQTSPTQQAAAS
ncbi:MAG: hypothetical protein C0154_06255, partial [Mucilaginibacter sp.]